MTTCPKCGEPARIIILTAARVRCMLLKDGSIGTVLSVAGRQKNVENAGFECGGGHKWTEHNWNEPEE